MYKAYFVTTTYPQIKDRKKEIARGVSLESCRKAFQNTKHWEYILYLIDKGIENFDEYVYITGQNGDEVFNTKQFIKEELDKNGPIHISVVIDKVMKDIENGIKEK